MAHNTQFFTFEVSYQLTFRGPSTMVPDDAGSTTATSTYLKMVSTSGVKVARLSVAKMRAAAALTDSKKALDLVY